LIAENELLPLNFDNIPNAKYIDESFRNLGYDPGKQVFCAIFLGTLGILYNKKMVQEEVDSWIFCGTASTRVKL